MFQKDFDDEDLNRLELKIETRAKIKEMLVDTKKEKNTIVKYLSYSKIIVHLSFENSRPVKFDARCQIFDVDALSNDGHSRKIKILRKWIFCLRSIS